MADRNPEVSPINALIDADCTQFVPKTILIVGDAMTDVYVTGRLETGCQDGCEKFVEESRVGVPGGAANVVRSLNYWNTKKLFPTDEQKGPIKTRFVAGNRFVFRHDDETTKVNFDLVRKDMMETLRGKGIAAVIISDYDKGLLTPSFINNIITMCKRRNIPCVADAKREPELYAGSILKCNNDYYCKHKNKLKSWRRLVRTMGASPPDVYFDGEFPLIQSGSKVECINHVGAGDCFAAHLALALAHKLTLVEAAEIAHSAGRIYVQHPYNRPPRPNEIRKDLNNVYYKEME